MPRCLLTVYPSTVVRAQRHCSRWDSRHPRQALRQNTISDPLLLPLLLLLLLLLGVVHVLGGVAVKKKVPCPEETVTTELRLVPLITLICILSVDTSPAGLRLFLSCTTCWVEGRVPVAHATRQWRGTMPQACGHKGWIRRAATAPATTVFCCRTN
jgi:hypothetical protein